MIAEINDCLLTGHHWSVDGPPRGTKKTNRMGLTMTLRCDLCGSDREDILDLNGRVMYRTYHLSHGYKANQADYIPKPTASRRTQARAKFLRSAHA